MQVKVKKLSPNAVIPAYAKNGDAALDLTAISYTSQDANCNHIYGTGLAIEIPEGHVGLLFPRSSLCKYDLALTNSVGVIDSGYRGEIKFVFKDTLVNVYTGQEDIYKIGDRIGQIIIIPYPKIELVESEELSDTERGTGGFGSSGV